MAVRIEAATSRIRLLGTAPRFDAVEAGARRLGTLRQVHDSTGITTYPKALPRERLSSINFGPVFPLSLRSGYRRFNLPSVHLGSRRFVPRSLTRGGGGSWVARRTPRSTWPTPFGIEPARRPQRIIPLSSTRRQCVRYFGSRISTRRPASLRQATLKPCLSMLG